MNKELVPIERLDELRKNAAAASCLEELRDLQPEIDRIAGHYADRPAQVADERYAVWWTNVRSCFFQKLYYHRDNIQETLDCEPYHKICHKCGVGGNIVPYLGKDWCHDCLFKEEES